MGRIPALLLIAPLLTYASALAPQHVHVAGPGHGPVAHSHFAPHASSVPRTQAAHVDDEIEADIEHVVWLETVAIHEPAFQLARVQAALARISTLFFTPRTWFVRAQDECAPAHGPPKRVSPVRGPPASSSELI